MIFLFFSIIQNGTPWLAYHTTATIQNSKAYDDGDDADGVDGEDASLMISQARIGLSSDLYVLFPQ